MVGVCKVSIESELASLRQPMAAFASVCRSVSVSSVYLGVCVEYVLA